MIFKRASGAIWKIAWKDVRAEGWRPVRSNHQAIIVKTKMLIAWTWVITRKM